MRLLIVGAQVVFVPFARAAASADRAFRGFMISLITVLAAKFAVVDALLYVLWVRPVRKIARIADRLSVGDMSAAAFPQHGSAQIESLVRSFNRLRTSLDKALRLLDSRGRSERRFHQLRPNRWISVFCCASFRRCSASASEMSVA